MRDFECPAYKVTAYAGQPLKHGDEVAVLRETKSHGTLVDRYKLGSVAGYAKQYDEDPDEAVERAMRLNHKLFWANGMGVSLTDYDEPQEVFYGVEHGDVIDFEGAQFRIEPDWNNNIKLVAVVEADA